MRNISTMLGSGNLTPRERFLLLIQNDVRKMKTRKEFLTEADKAALLNWHAKTNEEAREWNRLNDGWQYTGRIDLGVEFNFNDAQVDHFQVKPVIMELLRQPFHREMEAMFEGVKNLKKISAAGAIEITQKQRAAKLRDGLDFESAVYQFAFERLSEEYRAKFIELYPDIEVDPQYLDDEEIIAHLLGGREALDAQGKEKLAALMAERCYNKFAKEYQLFHYFACIPLAEVARYFLVSKGIDIGGKPLSQNQEADDADDITHKEIGAAVKRYANEHATTVEAILKEGFTSWYDAEGFVYTPLAVSDDKDLFERWLRTKAEARAELHRLVDAGALQLRERTPEETRRDKLYSKRLIDTESEIAKKMLETLEVPIGEDELGEKKAFETFSDKVITGDSLYNFPGDFAFVKDFKERTDEYDPNLGLVYADDDPEHAGEHLDRELLICPLDGAGELSFFSPYGISLMRLEALFDSLTFFKQGKKGDAIVLAFNNKQVEKMFRGSRDSFIAAYAKLLAAREVLRKLSATYDADLVFRVDILLGHLDGYIENHNEALRGAQRTFKSLEHGANSDDVEGAANVFQVDQDLFIDKNAITPDASVIEEHTSKLKGIFGDF